MKIIHYRYILKTEKSSDVLIECDPKKEVSFSETLPTDWIGFPKIILLFGLLFLPLNMSIFHN